MIKNYEKYIDEHKEDIIRECLFGEQVIDELLRLVLKNRQLKKERASIMTALTISKEKYNNDKARYRRKYKKIRKNWNSLREWIKDNYNENIIVGRVVYLDELLDKMNELEGDNNGTMD